MPGSVPAPRPIGVLLVVLVAAACSGGGAPGAERSPAAAPSTRFEVTLTEFAFDPASIRAPAGREITFEVVNEGAVPHRFAVDTGEGIVETRELGAGQTQTLLAPALAAGQYRIFCGLVGHEEAGMVGSLEVVRWTGTDEAPDVDLAEPPGAPGLPGDHGIGAQEMLDGHRASVLAFPAETQAHGNRPLEPAVQDGVKVFELTTTELLWETEPGAFVDAMAYEGTVPGPELRVRPGDRVRIVVRNEMTQPTTLHLHGVTVPHEMDGVPFLTQDPIMPGGFFTYSFEVVDPPGMYVYHSHFNSAEQVGRGLYGALYVEPTGGFDGFYGVDVEHTLFLGDGPTGYVLNGKGFPATLPIEAALGDTVLIHLSNEGAQTHSMHLHGHRLEVVARDGMVLDRPYPLDTLALAPGQRFDVLVRAERPGTWALHCHLLPHSAGPEGMFGMVTALVVR